MRRRVGPACVWGGGRGCEFGVSATAWHAVPSWRSALTPSSLTTPPHTHSPPLVRVVRDARPRRDDGRGGEGAANAAHCGTSEVGAKAGVYVGRWKPVQAGVLSHGSVSTRARVAKERKNTAESVVGVFLSTNGAPILRLLVLRSAQPHTHVTIALALTQPVPPPPLGGPRRPPTMLTAGLLARSVVRHTMTVRALATAHATAPRRRARRASREGGGGEVLSPPEATSAASRRASPPPVGLTPRSLKPGAVSGWLTLDGSEVRGKWVVWLRVFTLSNTRRLLKPLFHPPRSTHSNRRTCQWP